MKSASHLVTARLSGEGLWARFCALAQRMFSQRAPRKLRVSETLALGEKRQLMIVECGGRQLLIGAAGNFLTTLAELHAETDESREHFT